jgi:hypothetical protein
LVEANVSEKGAVSIFRAEVHHFSPEDENNTLLRNVVFYQPIHIEIQPQITLSELSAP